jgi:NADPH-dependent curcumin reductase CurA
MAAVEVMASHHDGFAPGDLVTAVTAWQDLAVLTPDKAAVPVTRIPPGIDVADAMTIFSPNTLTAYFGLLAAGEPKPGMTVLVSGAAGSVGAMVCQMAVIAGCRVVALAGGADKCRWLEKERGVAAAIDYRSQNLAERLKAACPDGINIFFDNVGGDILQHAIDRMVPHSRIVLCGQISAYDTGRAAPGPADMMRLVYGRIRMEGFVVGDFADRYESAYSDIRKWHAAGRIRCRVDMRDGFGALPEAFVDLFQGKNAGTLLVRNTPSE